MHYCKLYLWEVLKTSLKIRFIEESEHKKVHEKYFKSSQGREETKNSHELKTQSGNKTHTHEERKNENSGHGKVARGKRNASL